MSDVRAHFRDLAAASLPEGSRILVPRGSGTLTIFATWALPAETSRGVERSRMIRIAITEDALDDYASRSDGRRTVSDGRFVAWLGEKMASFDPQQRSPLHIEPLPVTWPMDTHELNG